MAYVKNTWVDQAGQVRYTETEDDGYKIFTANYEEVTEIGTPVNATNMNHIEDGIGACDTAITSLTSQVTALDSSVVKKTGNQTISDTKTFTGTIKVPNTATTGTAVSTQAISKSGNGYIKFGNGIIIQWGTNGGSGSRNITFPTAFTSNPRPIVCPNSATIRTYNFAVTSISTTKMTVYGEDACVWLAIGY